MKVENYSYETFPEYNQEIEEMIEVNGDLNNLRVRMQDIVYDNEDNLIIRLLMPNTILDETRKYPLIIHVQGSGWYDQDMNDHIFDFMEIVKAGYCIAIIQYHSAPKYQFPTQIIDTKKAISYLKKHNREYPIDINSVFLSGDSSGGHTALMTLFTYYSRLYQDSTDDLLPLRGMLDFYGVTNFLTFNQGYSKYDEKEMRNSYDLLGSWREDNLSLYQKASPVYYIKPNLNLPPILILHGSKDHVVPFEQSVELYYKLKEYNYDVSLCKVIGADHGRSIFYVKSVFNVIINFLNQHK